MKKIFEFIKSEAVLSIAAAAAVISMFWVHPDKEYIEYCNFEVLGILFCLMLTVAGFGYSGVFDFLTGKLQNKIHSEKMLIFCLVAVCFFSSALITNDVALITFVPFTIAMLKKQGGKSIIFAVTLETVAANLGSLMTPIGNPQNLFLYSYYNMNIGEFFKTVLPLGFMCLVIICTVLALRKNRELKLDNAPNLSCVKRKSLILYSMLFVLSILSVLKIVPWYISLIICAVCVLIHKKELFSKADYILLITFVCFFVFVGNMSRIDEVRAFMSQIIEGRELLVSAIASQIISNVPAAAMLASFTDNAKGLILGTNIGGLGTLIASMASLISYRQICKTEGVKPIRYLGYFTLVNTVFLAVLLGIYTIIL